jgi:hypothetical protein
VLKTKKDEGVKLALGLGLGEGQGDRRWIGCQRECGYRREDVAMTAT